MCSLVFFSFKGFNFIQMIHTIKKEYLVNVCTKRHEYTCIREKIKQMQKAMKRQINTEWLIMLNVGTNDTGLNEAAGGAASVYFRKATVLPT